MLAWIVSLGALVLPLAGAQHPPALLHVYLADHEASRLFVVAHKTGLLSFLGHDHAIAPTAWTADLCLANPIPAGAHATLVVQTDSLVIDSHSARAMAGLGGGPGSGERRHLQHTMLDAKHLDAARFPHVRLDLRAAAPSENGHITVRGSLDLHGVTRPVTVPVTIRQRGDGSLELSGTLRIGQRDFGIKPASVAGVVKVANVVDLHFLLVVRPTARSCSATVP